MKEHKDLIMPAALSGPHEMELNPITLSFSKDIEKNFLDDYFKNSLNLVRVSLLAGIIFYGLFSILDAQLFPDLKGKLFFIRFAVVSPLLMFLIILSYFHLFKKYFQALVATAMIVAGSGIIIMIYITPPPANFSYYAGLILVFIWGYSFTRVRFIWATLAGWIIVAFYEIVAVKYTNTPFPVLISNNFFILSANIIGMFVCYSIEYYTRVYFYANLLLEKEQEKIKSANIKLEGIVKERTAQLSKTNEDLHREIEERKHSDEERAKLEAQLHQVQKLDAIDTLAGGIAHDFNNLLMGIQSGTTLVLHNLDTDDPNYKKLQSAETYIRKCAELTRQLLGVARKGKYEVVSTDLNELIKKNSQMFGRTKKDIVIYTNYQNGIWMVEIDQLQIEQVLLNLYVNAGQAMPDGGNLYIRTENVTLNRKYLSAYGLEPGNYVKTGVTDTGIGMDKATQDKVFDPFFTTKDIGRGTGLGLASAYGIIKNHKGFFQVYSEINKGTTFNFYLPASEDQVVQKSEEVSEVIKGTGRILLIDDEEMITIGASEMLETLGYRIDIAKSGKDAIEIYQTNFDKIDLVILDMVMPVMSGSEVYDILKQINPDVKVLLSSGYSIDGSATEILKRGCEGFIQKPFNLTNLSQKLNEILGDH
jgi:signal transduction histidine kinase/ActR/RegA family two-component response regulator